MALGLLPILLLGVIQTEAEFRKQEQERRLDLQLAAERSASDAKARISSTVVLLQALTPEGGGFFCEARLTALAARMEGITSLARYSATGAPVCASRSESEAQTKQNVSADTWHQRLKRGEDVVMQRSADGESLIVAVRWERPMGAFQGAMAATVPLSVLQPDIRDPALPAGSEAALTDGAGNILIATDPRPFALKRAAEANGWTDRARADAVVMFEARDAQGRRNVYGGAPLAGQDVFVLLSAPAPGLLSWARLNPFGTLLLPLAAWLTAFAAVMLLSERIVVRWLDYLERVAAIYARGRFSIRPVQAEHAPAEIRTLARTLGQLGETITRRDRDILDALEEKDALLREIHHRVKNNLQIISSLLSMQQRAVTDLGARAALGDTRQRITALAQIYRVLYQSEDIREADADTFLRELVGQLIAGEAVRGPLVTTSIEADPLIIDPDKLAPLALWLVEAVSNAQKHAFAGRGGELKVRFKVDGDTSVLEVEDDGPGLDDAVEAGVGRTLMMAFAKQLRGEARIIPAPGGGSIARLTFVTPEARDAAQVREVAAFRLSGTPPQA
ncbi:sensor histidine kinase [Brevundimonas sp. M1A4_2e]